MPRAPYQWDSNVPPIIRQHSIAKLEVLRAYLLEYFQTLVAPQHDALRLTLVDGFAGGGIYKHEITRDEILGSPFVFLQAATEAQDLINQGRQKPFRIEADYIFVDEDPAAISLLESSLRARAYGSRIGTDIRLLKGQFEAVAGAIRASIKQKNPRNGRAIFFLDQYGYKEVPASLINSIFCEMPAAEVILTFNVDAFINFASDSKVTDEALRRMGTPNALRGRSIDEIKKSEKDFRLYIQACLYQDLVDACGARFYTVFFIRTQGHGDYWLVHLSQHPRARDVMTQVHWSKNNHFIHYGGAGIDMFRALGYDAASDASLSGQDVFGFCFDNPAAIASVSALTEQLPHLIYSRPEGLTFGELFTATCNLSPADSAKYKEALSRLASQKEIHILGPDGSRRWSANTITDRDQVVPSKQASFTFGSV